MSKPQRQISNAQRHRVALATAPQSIFIVPEQPDPEAQDKLLLQKLIWLCDAFPHRKRELRACLEEIREDMAPRPQSPRDAVFEAIIMGFGTIPEIRERTRLTDWVVRKIIKELCELCLIKKGDQGDTINKASVKFPDLYIATQTLP